MISPELRARIRRMFYAEHWKMGTIAAELGVHRDTVALAVEPERFVNIALRPQYGLLDPYKNFVRTTLEQYPRLRATRLLQMLQPRGYSGSIWPIRRFVRHVRPLGSREAFFRLSTLPGEQGQVDWASFGTIPVGNTQRALSCFVMVLSWCRAIFARFVLDQTLESFRRMPWKGRRVGWTFPSKKSLAAILRKVRSLTDRSTVYQSLKGILHAINPVLRGWSNYFRYDASKRTLAYVDSFAWRRVFRWLRKKHPERTWKYLRKRYCGGRWTIQDEGVELFRPSKVRVERYRYRGTRILLQWMAPDELGEVGRYANSEYDDPSFLGSLQEALDVS
jgi:Group II intron, maturase-specific domain